jgi:hypothetical protein
MARLSTSPDGRRKDKDLNISKEIAETKSKEFIF